MGVVVFRAIHHCLTVQETPEVLCFGTLIRSSGVSCRSETSAWTLKVEEKTPTARQERNKGAVRQMRERERQTGCRGKERETWGRQWGERGRGVFAIFPNDFQIAGFQWWPPTGLISSSFSAELLCGRNLQLRHTSHTPALQAHATAFTGCSPLTAKLGCFYYPSSFFRIISQFSDFPPSGHHWFQFTAIQLSLKCNLRLSRCINAAMTFF